MSSKYDIEVVTENFPMDNLSHHYDPYSGCNDNEIPCFRIYADTDPIAETSENLPKEIQENAARLFIKSHELLEGLQKAIE